MAFADPLMVAVVQLEDEEVSAIVTVEEITSHRLTKIRAMHVKEKYSLELDKFGIVDVFNFRLDMNKLRVVFDVILQIGLSKPLLISEEKFTNNVSTFMVVYDRTFPIDVDKVVAVFPLSSAETSIDRIMLLVRDIKEYNIRLVNAEKVSQLLKMLKSL